MRRALVPFVATLIVTAVAACRDVPAPESGVLSISPVILPAPAVVVGDTMRDSTGQVAPLRVIAYGVGGAPLDPQPTPTFALLDTGAAHLAGGFLIGDKAAASVRIVGNVAGLQTLFTIALVTLEPDTIVTTDSLRRERPFSLLAGDTAVNADLNVQVQHTAGAAPAGVDGVIVKYEITRAPPSVGTGASVVLLNGSVLSSRDTTSGGGRASRTLRFRLAAASPTTDSAFVVATAAYRGQALGAVQFTIVFKAQ